jgi:formylglycine-generating enzyme required for sulfatase activity
MNREPTLFPPQWAEAWGDDLYGLWAEFVIGEQRQRMRWIEPGQFWMGSPGPSDPELPPEPERRKDEGPRHRVTLSAGIWLADTACTQALWTAVMGSNPSRFSDDAQCPVERVSFEDVQAFLTALRPAGVDGEADLPTEAQWEYACRAGTNTSFYFGAQIASVWMNYNGNFPYQHGAKGDYRRRTVPVKALPANRWGLYQMHGNVWEWCRDPPRTYTDAEVRDPEDPVGAARALRGGSWFDVARRCRSARRRALEPGVRSSYLGFRPVLRS